MVVFMKTKKEIIFYSGMFLFFTLIFFLSPISGDDWGNYLVGKTGIYHSFGNAIGMYFSWEGRLVSRILINLLTYHKVLWNIINSLVIVSSIYFMIKLIQPKHKFLVLSLSFFLFLGMNLYTFSQVIVWIAGNITYLFVIPLLLFYFYQLFSSNKNSLWKIILFSIINIISTMFVEHMAIILILSNLFFLGYSYYQKKKIRKEILFYLVLSIISTSFMLLSPGTRLRNSVENLEFNQLSLFGKFFYNLPNFIYYTFISNYTLLPILIISNCYLVKNTISNKGIRLIHYFYYIFPLFTMIGSILSFLDISTFSFFSNQNHFINILYYLFLSLDMFILLILYTKNHSIKSLFFFLIGLFSTGVMMLSPTWGYRVSVATYLFLGISCFMILDDNISYKKIYSILVSMMNIIFVVFFLILYISVHYQYMDNLKVIKKGIQNDSKTISIREYPSFVNCNINPSNSYHLEKFKEYYGISKDTDIILLENNWKYKLVYKK